MQMHADDDSFEIYLKQFRPRAPEALPTTTRVRKTRRALALAAWAAAIVLASALLSANWAPKLSRTSTAKGNWNALQKSMLQPLTICSANELLARAPSFKAAMNELVFASEEKTVPKSQSVFELLSKEDVNP